MTILSLSLFLHSFLLSICLSYPLKLLLFPSSSSRTCVAFFLKCETTKAVVIYAFYIINGESLSRSIIDICQCTLSCLAATALASFRCLAAGQRKSNEGLTLVCMCPAAHTFGRLCWFADGAYCDIVEARRARCHTRVSCVFKSPWVGERVEVPAVACNCRPSTCLALSADSMSEVETKGPSLNHPYGNRDLFLRVVFG